MARASKLKAAPGSIHRANKKVVEITTKKSEARKISSRLEQSILTKPPNFDYKNSEVHQLFDSREYPDCTYTTSQGWVDVADACIFIADMETGVEGGTVGGTLDVYLKTQAVCRRCNDDLWSSESDCEAAGNVWFGELDWTEASCTGAGYTWYSGELNMVYFEIHKGNEGMPNGNQYIENVGATLDVNSDIYPGGYISASNVGGTYGVVWLGGGGPVGEGIFAKVDFDLDGSPLAWQGLCIRNFVGMRPEDQDYPVRFNDSSISNAWIGMNARTCTGACTCPSETSTMFTCLKGDLNGDYRWNIQDILTMSNCILDGTCLVEEPANTVWCTSNLLDIGANPEVNIIDLQTLLLCVLEQNCGAMLNGNSVLDQAVGAYEPPEGMTEAEQRILLGNLKKIASKYTARPDAKVGAREIHEFINKNSLLSSSINGNINNIQVTNQTKDSLEFSWNDSCTNCDGSLLSLTTNPLESVNQSAYGNNYLISKNDKLNNSLSSINKRINKIMYGDENRSDVQCMDTSEAQIGIWNDAQVCLSLRNVDPYAGTLEINMENKPSCQWCSDDLWSNEEDCEDHSGEWYLDLTINEDDCRGSWHDGEVAGFQFNIYGMTVTGVTGGTSNLLGNVMHSTSVNADGDTYNTVIGFSTTGTTILPGDETLLHISFDPVTVGEEYLAVFATQDGRICMWDLVISDSEGNEMSANNGFEVSPPQAGRLYYIYGPGCWSCHCPEATANGWDDGGTFDCPRGDLNGDGAWDIMDIIILVKCVLLDHNCWEQDCPFTADCNGDGVYNVLDLMELTNCALVEDCGEAINGDAGMDNPAAPIVLEFPANAVTDFVWGGPSGPVNNIFNVDNAEGLSSISTQTLQIKQAGNASALWYPTYSFFAGSLAYIEPGLPYKIVNGSNIKVTLTYKYGYWWSTPYKVPYGFTKKEHTELVQELRTAITEYSEDLKKENSKIAFNSLNEDTTYYLKNTFFNAYGSSDTFEFQTSTLSEPPDAAPASLSFSGNSQTGINLGWVNNCSNEEEVRIFLDVDYGFKPFEATDTLQPGSTSYTFTGLTADTDYNVWVDFYNTGGNRGITGDFTTLETGPDDSPTNLAIVTLGATSLHLMWDNNATNEDGIYIYRNSIDVKPATPYSTIYATTPNQCYDSNAGCTGVVGSGLTPATEYFYWVSFFNTGGESNATSGSTFTFEVAPDAAPSNLSLVPGATAIALSFTNAATNDDGVKIYRALVNTQPNNAYYTLTGTNITSLYDNEVGSINSLDPATEYFYWVSNFNEIAESSTTSGSTSTLEVAPDAAPSNLSLVPGATSIALSFTNAATNDDGVNIYKNTMNIQPQSPGIILTGTNITSHTDDGFGGGLQQGTLYYYWIANYNEIAESSTVSGATTTQTSGTTWYHAHGGAMEINANCSTIALSIRLNNAIGHHHAPPTIAVGDYLKLDNEEMLVTLIPYTTRPVVTRAQNGTTAAFHAAGTDVYVDHS